MHPRRLILPNQSFAHVFFRCHNRSFFFKDTRIKLQLILLWAKYRRKYGIEIYDFIIMDNHAHLLVKSPSAECLGHFMRTVNSQIARKINCFFNRDSQAIRERYKSPLITNGSYLLRTIQYIWVNRFKVNGSDPSTDPFCSASWRLNKDFIRRLAPSEKEHSLLDSLLASYHNFPEPPSAGAKAFVRNLLNEARSRALCFLREVFECSHTVGDQPDREFRAEYLGAFSRNNVGTGPPFPLPY